MRHKFHGVAILKEDVTTEYNGTIIAILAGTNVTLMRKKMSKGYDAEAIVSKDDQLLRIIFTVYKKELKDIQTYGDEPSGALPESEYGKISV